MSLFTGVSLLAGAFGAATALSVALPASPAAAATATTGTLLSVDLTGTFDGLVRSKTVAGVQTTSGPSGSLGSPFSFSVSCVLNGASPQSSASSCTSTSGSTIAWDYGDGTTTSNTSTTVSHAYTKPGTYTVSATIKTSLGYGKATMRALVSPYFSDVPPSPSLTSQASSGSTVLNVSSTAPYSPGQVVYVDPTNPNQEQRTVASVSGSSISLTTGLTSTHATGAVISVGLPRGDRESIWTVAALGLMTPCKVNSADGFSLFCPAPSTTSAPSGIPVSVSTTTTGSVSQSSTHVNTITVASTKGLFAGQTLTIDSGTAKESAILSSISGSTVTLATNLVNAHSSGIAVTATPALTEPAVNGITGADCLALASNCGLPASYFLDTGTNQPSATAPCNTTCQSSLAAAGYLALPPGGTALLGYNANNCGDNYIAVQAADKTWSTAPGTKPGCETRNDFFTTYTAALDGVTPTQAATKGFITSSIGCPDATSQATKRAQALGLTLTQNHSTGTPFCDLSGVMTKSQAYLSLGTATNRTNNLSPGTTSAIAGFSDISTNTSKNAFGSLVAAGSPVVGTTSCPGATGVCFNPGDAITRGQTAQLVASTLVGPDRVSGGINVNVSSDNNPQPANSPIHLRTTVTLPAWYTSGTVTVSWATGSGSLGCATPYGGTSSTYGSSTNITGSEGTTVGYTNKQTLTMAGGAQAVFSCDAILTGQSASTLSVVAQSSAMGTVSPTGNLTLASTQSAPSLGVAQGLNGTNSAPFTVYVPAYNPQSGAPNSSLVYKLTNDSGESGTGRVNSGTNSFYQTGASTNLTPASSANLAVGTITVTSSTDQGATLTVTPNAATRHYWGPYSFSLQACEGSSSYCASATYTGLVDAVAQKPSVSNQSLSNNQATMPVTLSSTAPDWGAPCFGSGSSGVTSSSSVDMGATCPKSSLATPITASAIQGYNITSGPSLTGNTLTATATAGGTVTYSSTQSAPGTQVGPSLTFNSTRWGSTDSFTYTATANGFSTPTNAAITSNPATVTLTSTAPAAPTNMACTPGTGSTGLSWTPIADNRTTGYKVYRTDQTNTSTQALNGTAPGASTSGYTDSVGAPTNLLPTAVSDGSDTTKWTLSGTTPSVALALATAATYSGTSALRFTAATSGTGSYTLTSSTTTANMAPVSPNFPYQATAELQTVGVATTATIAIKWYTAAGALISTSTPVSTTSSSTDWTRLDTSTTNVAGSNDISPANAAYAAVVVNMPSLPASTGVRFDQALVQGAYSYKVTAVDGQTDETAYSSSASCFGSDPAPTTPTLSSGFSNTTANSMSWTTPTTAEYYNLIARQDAGPISGTTTSVSPDITHAFMTSGSFIHSSLSSFTMYDYSVQACNYSGCSAWYTTSGTSSIKPIAMWTTGTFTATNCAAQGSSNLSTYPGNAGTCVAYWSASANADSFKGYAYGTNASGTAHVASTNGSGGTTTTLTSTSPSFNLAATATPGIMWYGGIGLTPGSSPLNDYGTSSTDCSQMGNQMTAGHLAGTCLWVQPYKATTALGAAGSGNISYSTWANATPSPGLVTINGGTTSAGDAYGYCLIGLSHTCVVNFNANFASSYEVEFYTQGGYTITCNNPSNQSCYGTASNQNVASITYANPGYNSVQLENSNSRPNYYYGLGIGAGSLYVPRADVSAFGGTIYQNVWIAGTNNYQCHPTTAGTPPPYNGCQFTNWAYTSAGLTNAASAIGSVTPPANAG